MNSYNDDQEWDLVIKPKTNIFDLNLKDIWRYRDLLTLFVKRDFIAQYKQTILGPLWNVIQPVFTTVMFMLVFSKIANIPTDGIKAPLFYMSGLTIWTYFSTCLMSISNTFVTNAPIFGKVYFPRLVLPISIMLSNMVRFAIQFALLLVLMVWYQFHGYPIYIGFSWLLIPVIIIIMGAMGLGLGIIISSLTTKYRDFALLLAFGIQLLMYATPIAYPLSYLKGKSYRAIIMLNPLTSVTEAFRYALFGKGTFTSATILYSVGFVAASLFIGLLIFTKVEKTFMDTV